MALRERELQSFPPKASQEASKERNEEEAWLSSLAFLLSSGLKEKLPSRAAHLFTKLAQKLEQAGLCEASPVRTPYLNTIPKEEEPPYPGDYELERSIRNYIRWNAMAMVVKANRNEAGIGGHISTYASCATLVEVGFHHFFRAPHGDFPGDFVYFQGHASPGIYARAYLEGRLSSGQLHNFRREMQEGGGLSSYPHPYLMPHFWQFPTVSMGLGPLQAVYQARFLHYLKARKLLRGEIPRVYCFVGDGEMDEPEALASVAVAGREKLDNLIFIVNCNLQRLDGPVRGNGKIIQELEGLFRGAGWEVLKVIWGSDWDPLLEADSTGLLAQRMEEAVDGDYQKYSVAPGSFTRRHFFGKYPELLELVNPLSDAQIHKLLRGGHDSRKVYAAYHRAVHSGKGPTVILAKTLKGYGLGEAGEGRNITHQQKKLNEKELREFRNRFHIPLDDDEVAEAPFCRPPEESPEMRYLRARREALGGYLPARKSEAPPLSVPELSLFEELLKGSGNLSASTTMAFARALSKLLGHKTLGSHIVPIIPDEARTFGLDALFRDYGIYSSKGQLYDPVDSESLLYYREAKDGQILEEGITEAGAMASFIAAGTSYSTLGKPMIPLYIYYSMFGLQRVGDLMWAAGDSRAKGFLLGATAGRTTLNGEGLQHQDGHSLLAMSVIPTLLVYDPAFAYELAVILHEGLRRMVQEGEDLFYYLTLYNENYPMPPLPEGVKEGILRGLYPLRRTSKGRYSAHLLASGPLCLEALRAQEILSRYGVAATVWSATSFKSLRQEALLAQRWNMLHPEEPPRRSYLEETLSQEDGVFVAVTDYVRQVPDQIAPWVPGGLLSLGTDGFGRSDTRSALRRFFEVDAEFAALATLYQLARKKKLSLQTVEKARRDLGIDPDKSFPELAF